MNIKNLNHENHPPANHEKHPLPTTKTPLQMEHCCQSCGSLRPIAAFQSGFKTLKTCSTCRERKARSKASSRPPVRQRVALAPLPESDLNSPRRRVALAPLPEPDLNSP